MSIGPLELLIIVLFGFLLLGGGVFVAAVIYGVARRAEQPSAASSDRMGGGPGVRAGGVVEHGVGATAEESAPETADKALAIARERYARGEINREEFEQIKATLGF